MPNWVVGIAHPSVPLYVGLQQVRNGRTNDAAKTIYIQARHAGRKTRLCKGVEESARECERKRK